MRLFECDAARARERRSSRLLLALGGAAAVDRLQRARVLLIGLRGVGAEVGAGR